MSNPAVIKLQQKNIGKSRVWLDDNLGEAIHIHIDDIRVDLTTEEFDNIYHDIADAINAMVMVNGFDCNKIDPVYLEVLLWENLLHLKEVKKSTVKLGELLAPGKKGIYPLPESRAVRALNGDTKENDGPRLSHHIGQTSEERLNAMMDSIQKNGYPWNDDYIVLYGDDNIIRDGQHRAACLYKLMGDIEVPVVRYYFDNYVPEDVKKTRKKGYRIVSKIKEHIHRIRNIKSLYTELRSLARKIKARGRKKKVEKYRKKYAEELKISCVIIDNK